MHSPTPMVYFSTGTRPQVLLFGRNIVLTPGTRLVVGHFTMVTGENDQKCIVKRITVQGEQQRICSNRVDEILLALVDLRASYPDIVHFLSQAHQKHSIN